MISKLKYVIFGNARSLRVFGKLKIVHIITWKTVGYRLSHDEPLSVGNPEPWPFIECSIVSELQQTTLKRAKSSIRRGFKII